MMLLSFLDTETGVGFDSGNSSDLVYITLANSQLLEEFGIGLNVT